MKLDAVVKQQAYMASLGEALSGRVSKTIQENDRTELLNLNEKVNRVQIEKLSIMRSAFKGEGYSSKEINNILKPLEISLEANHRLIVTTLTPPETTDNVV